MYICAFVGSLLPPPPARPHPLSLSVFGALSVFIFVFAFFLWVPPWSRSSLLTRALRLPPPLLHASPVSRPRGPSHACFSSHPPSLCGSCLLFSVRPLSLCRAVTRVRRTRALHLPLSVVPTLSPGGSPTLVFFPRSLSLSTSGMPWFTVWGGGVTCELERGLARGRVRHWPLGFDDRDVPHAARTSGK